MNIIRLYLYMQTERNALLVMVWKRVWRTSRTLVSVSELPLEEDERDEDVVKDDIAFRCNLQKGVR